MISIIYAYVQKTFIWNWEHINIRKAENVDAHNVVRIGPWLSLYGASCVFLFPSVEWNSFSIKKKIQLPKGLSITNYPDPCSILANSITEMVIRGKNNNFLYLILTN